MKRPGRFFGSSRPFQNKKAVRMLDLPTALNTFIMNIYSSHPRQIGTKIKIIPIIVVKAT
jgi:hypothetical protein